MVVRKITAVWVSGQPLLWLCWDPAWQLMGMQLA